MTALTMSAVLEHYGADLGKVKDYGWRSLRCPFHSDHVASGRVNLELGAYKCMACDASGDCLKLISNAEGVDREHAAKWADSELGASDSGIRGAARHGHSRQRPVWRHTLLD